MQAIPRTSSAKSNAVMYGSAGIAVVLVLHQHVQWTPPPGVVASVKPYQQTCLKLYSITDPELFGSGVVRYVAGPRSGRSGVGTAVSGLWPTRDMRLLTPSCIYMACADIRSIVNWGRDTQFTAPVQFGNQEFELVVDTGSGSLWVFVECTNQTECGGVPLYDPSKSPSYTALNSAGQFSIQYGIGTADGIWGQDKVSMGGQSYPNTTFGEVSHSTEWEGQGTNISGLIGFSWPGAGSLIQDRHFVMPLWYELAKQWTNKAFSMYLQRETVTMNSTQEMVSMATPGGVLTLGGWDSTYFTGDINFINFTDAAKRSLAYWQIPVQGASIKGKPMRIGGGGRDMPSQEPAEVMFDSGTTLILGPASQVGQFYDVIEGSFEYPSPGSGNYMFPCDTIPKFDLSFRFGGVDYPIYDNDMVAASYSRAYLESFGGSGDKFRGADHWCMGAIAATEDSTPPWIFGDAFLKNVYTVYRADPPSIGLAAINPNVNNTFQGDHPTFEKPTSSVSQPQPDKTGDSSPSKSGADAAGTSSATTSGGGDSSGGKDGGDKKSSAARTGAGVSAVLAAALIALTF